MADHGRRRGHHRPRLRGPAASIDVRDRARRPGGRLHRLPGDRSRARPDPGQGQGGARVTARRFPLWTALAVVLVVALVVGSGVLSSSPPTAAQRATAIESSLRCPSCEDLSVAQSSASTAVTVRATVTQLIAEGRTDQQIESYLVDRYGSSIVLDPPARGWSLLVWLLPLVGGLVALGALGAG